MTDPTVWSARLPRQRRFDDREASIGRPPRRAASRCGSEPESRPPVAPTRPGRARLRFGRPQQPEPDALLRQTYVESVGHCAFSPAEQHAALRTVVERLDIGRWPATDARSMNARASELGADAGPRYTSFDPPTFNRPYPG